jgi:hypothetical protein
MKDKVVKSWNLLGENLLKKSHSENWKPTAVGECVKRWQHGNRISNNWHNPTHPNKTPTETSEQ